MGKTAKITRRDTELYQAVNEFIDAFKRNKGQLPAKMAVTQETYDAFAKRTRGHALCPLVHRGVVLYVPETASE